MATEDKHHSFHIIGDVFLDYFAFADDRKTAARSDNSSLLVAGGDTVLSQPLTATAGGSGLNTATHLNHLLSSSSSVVHLHSVINERDEHGRQILDHIQKQQFEFHNCILETNNKASCCDSGSTGHCVVVVADQERSFLTHRGCLEHFQAAHVDTDLIILRRRSASSTTESPTSHAPTTHIHVSGFYNLPEFWNGKLLDVLKTMKHEHQQLGADSGSSIPQNSDKSLPSISLVPQYDASGQWDGGIVELIPLLDFLFLSEVEASKIAQRGLDNRSSNTNNTIGFDDQPLNISDCLDYFTGLTSTTCFVITRGARGALAFRNGVAVATIDQSVSVEIVDPTGAGDAFIAGFLHRIWNARTTTRLPKDLSQHDNDTRYKWNDDEIREALVWGCAMGTSIVQISGASTTLRLDMDIVCLRELVANYTQRLSP